MFSSALGRVARTASSCSPIPAGCRARAALHHAHQAVYRPDPPRRLSSSKPSTPPNNKKRPVEIEQSAATKQNAAPKPQGVRKQDGTHTTAKTPSTLASTTILPWVPPTNHLRKDDVKLQFFYGLHRPMSIQTAIPREIHMDQFNKILDMYRPNDAQTVQQTKTVLEGFLQHMYNEIDIQEEQRADAAPAQAHAQASVYHLDAPPTQQNIESWTGRLAPFIPPAVPVPHDQPATEAQTESFSAHEVSDSISQRITEVALPASQKKTATSFQRHVARRRTGMLLISVRRQRKLKMKKHKYKKLMKRTRLLRRKLDRL